MNAYVYSIGDSAPNQNTLYVNLTNQCTNHCVFCIRGTTDEINGRSLWLDNDYEQVTAEKVIKQFEEFPAPTEVVFCGYGEPLIQLEILKEIATFAKGRYDAHIRVNTNGHGNAIHKRDILPELKGLVDEFSISLNAPNEEQYKVIVNPKIPNAFEEVKEFIRKSVKAGFKTTATVVTEHKDYVIDVEESEKLALSLGAKFRVRKWLNKGY